MPDTKQSYGSIDSVDLTNKRSPKHGYRMVLITLVVLLVAVGGYIIAQRENLQQLLKGTTPPNAVTNQPATTGTSAQAVDVPSSSIKDREVPWLEVTSDDDATLTVGQTKKLYINGTSGNKDITGYDLLIAYDPTAIEIQSVESALADYELFKFDRGDHMTITGIKNFKKREPVTFDGGKLVELVVKAKKQGDTTVSLSSSIGQEKTQLVDAEVTVIEPQIGSFSLKIQ